MNVIEKLGLMVSDIDTQQLKQLELDSGVKIDRVAGVGEQAGAASRGYRPRLK